MFRIFIDGLPGRLHYGLRCHLQLRHPDRYSGCAVLGRRVRVAVPVGRVPAVAAFMPAVADQVRPARPGCC